MPRVAVRETTVYKLEELKGLPADKKGNTPYDRAIEKILEYSNDDNFYIQWLSEDMRQWFTDGRGKREDFECPFDGGTLEEWDYDRRTISFTVNVYLGEYMRRNKLRGKYRTLANWLDKNGDYYITGKVQSGYNRDSRFSPLPDDFGDELIYATTGNYVDKATEEKVEAQGEEVYKHIAGAAEWTRDHLMKWIKDDIDYRYSTEFAIEEADAQEMEFTAYGNIYR